LSVPDSDFLNAIKKDLGEQFILNDGNLNKKLLSFYIYNDDNILQKLNKITFDIVVKEIIKRAEENEDKELVIIDAPLLFESGLNKVCDYTISLIAPRELKIKRICKRDNISENDAIKRLDVQQTDSYYREKSDFIIENNEDTDIKKEFEDILLKINLM